MSVGGDAPVRLQSMTNTDTRDVEATLSQLQRLAQLGCEIARVAVPDQEAAAALPSLLQRSPLPLIADIHFDHRLALAALAAGVHGLRLNPGNIRNPEHVATVVRAARERAAPIRVGVNAGSLPPDLQVAHGDADARAAAMVAACRRQIDLLEALDFGLIKISLKASDVPTTVAAYRQLAQQVDYPFHLGITEAGTLRAGTVKSAVGLGILLADGIGDTLRVSLTAPPEEEIRVGWEILKALGLRQRGATLISCPSCGRTAIDLIGLANEVDEYLCNVAEPITVAVMGCVVNGPGEAREADLGVAGGKGRGAIFRRGEVVRTVAANELLSALKEEIERELAARRAMHA